MTVAQFGALALLVVTLFAPGLAVAAAAGVRGWLLVGTAPLVTYGVVAVAAPLAPALFGGWSVGVFALATAVLAAVLLGVRLLDWPAIAARLPGARTITAGRTSTSTRGADRAADKAPATAGTDPEGDADRGADGAASRWTAAHHIGVAGLLLGTGALGMFVVSRATGGFTAVHQFWDAIFHANAVRFIADTGLSRVRDLSVVTPDLTPGFYYPNTFHVQLSTVLQLNEGSVSELLNLRAGLTAGVFALSMVALVRRTIGRPALVAGVAVAAGAFSIYPYDLAYFGPLWPFSAALAVLPAFLALFVDLLDRPRPATVLLTTLAMIGLTATHLSVGLAGAVFCAAFLAQRWIAARRITTRDLAALAIPTLAAAVAVLPVMLRARRNTTTLAVDWPIIGTPGSALGQLLFLNHDSRYPQWWLVLAMGLGLLALHRLRPVAWWLAGGAFFTGLYVLAAAYEGSIVELLTGPWWNDRWRFIAIIAPVFVLLAGNGLVYARDQLLRLPLRIQRPAEFRWRAASLGLVLVVLAVLSNGLYRVHNVQRIAAAYTDGPTISTSERAALDELAKLVPAGTRVMNDSNDGSAWMLALNDLRPVFGHAIPPGMVDNTVDADRTLLYDRFDEFDTDPEVRAAVQRLDIEYVFIGEGFASPTSSRAPGLDELDRVRALDEVFANADARIYRIGTNTGTGS